MIDNKKIKQVLHKYFDDDLTYAETERQLVEILGDENEANYVLLGADWYEFTDD
jgi:hypothetical protein